MNPLMLVVTSYQAELVPPTEQLGSGSPCAMGVTLFDKELCSV